ncbi:MULTISPECIES: MarR family winged helix-turn-helix transcriptional regulator [unclassified Dietzia]|uniref:MarR family winged helix-turn-helix transcriptional regulator n=1 Tax=unclassified Dietzia TaxID=2617939 RepID=UPI001315B608|nr:MULTISPECIES: MarR family transcriptional regulator [unclassified Dietzia]QGW26291.1 putative MarR family transcriptional regulator [Dietzia sp. DQ12-45-1b]
MTDQPHAPASPVPGSPAPTDPTALATDLREALRPLWRRFAEHRTLSMGKVGILARLDRLGALTATDLAAHERISHQAVAGAVRELEAMGLVSRNPDPSDGRRVLVSLTGSGRTRLVAERSAGQEWLIRAVTDELSESDRATLAAAVPLLVRLDTEGPG